MRIAIVIVPVWLLLLTGCTSEPAKPAENRCLKRTEAPYGGYTAKWVRCPPGSPVVLPDY